MESVGRSAISASILSVVDALAGMQLLRIGVRDAAAPASNTALLLNCALQFIRKSIEHHRNLKCHISGCHRIGFVSGHSQKRSFDVF